MTDTNNEKEIFGSLFLGHSEFAVAVSHVQEVVNAPDKFASLPLSPQYLKGLFNLRGTVIPVIDLRILLHLGESTDSESQKIAIVELSGNCVGLLFDRTGEVFRSHPEERSDFQSGDFEGVISGVFKKESGKRIVQILDVDRLVNLKNVPKDSSRGRLERESLNRRRGHRKQCISFVVGPAKCALPMSDIQEILKVPRLDESALAGGFCMGTIDLRGTTVPIVDFTALLKYRDVLASSAVADGDRRVIVMRLEKELFGLLVDEVDSIISYFPDELLTFPVLEQNKSEMFVGCITGHGEHDFLLLDHQQILDNQEIHQITFGHSSLFKQKENKASKESGKDSLHRKTYITFKIKDSFAVGINEVKEIIDFPSQMLHPPGMGQHICGVLNLRGDLVTIVNARKMYSRVESEDHLDQAKVLVFNRNGMYFGLVVDEVESIVTVNDSDKIAIPKFLYDSDGISKDVSDAFEVPVPGGPKKSLLVLDMNSIAARVVTTPAA